MAILQRPSAETEPPPLDAMEARNCTKALNRPSISRGKQGPEHANGDGGSAMWAGRTLFGTTHCVITLASDARQLKFQAAPCGPTEQNLLF
eukprot:CAMPEP_0170267928 /NCGR_PEP_ID=MMETSP0116_2-20130129/33891_1 /TAXON_ID=400756 /ORGANISM="Durinskia baltica, Strain CSIRO CS-38" /LENGTH=90 /DNA_ID=CAMNT_0010519085 /DNA_START=36 /DNA_END=311 /DNA_ORIENTATION=-